MSVKTHNKTVVGESPVTVSLEIIFMVLATPTPLRSHAHALV